MEAMKVLFVCVHNSARSQMAEVYLNKMGGGKLIAESAGIEAGVLNPVVVQAMREDEIDISQNKTKSVFDLFNEERIYNYVITVCDEKSAEQCPVFPGVLKQLHWSFADPSAFTGTNEEKLQKTRIVRDAIKKKVQEFLNDHKI